MTTPAVTANNYLSEIVYFAVVGNGRRLAEILVTRRGGKQVSQVRTGVIYRTESEARSALIEKNCRASRAIQDSL